MYGVLQSMYAVLRTYPLAFCPCWSAVTQGGTVDRQACDRQFPSPYSCTVWIMPTICLLEWKVTRQYIVWYQNLNIAVSWQDLPLLRPYTMYTVHNTYIIAAATTMLHTMYITVAVIAPSILLFAGCNCIGIHLFQIEDCSGLGPLHSAPPTHRLDIAKKISLKSESDCIALICRERKTCWIVSALICSRQNNIKWSPSICAHMPRVCSAVYSHARTLYET